jgi:hypothetical protein
MIIFIVRDVTLSDTTRNAQVVTNLQQTCSNAVPTTCQQDVFAVLVPSLLTSCQWLVDNLLQGCWGQQTCYELLQQLVIVLQFNNFEQVVSHNLFKVVKLQDTCEWQLCGNLIKYQHCCNFMFAVLLWVCIHTGQAETFAWPRWELNPRLLGY